LLSLLFASKNLVYPHAPLAVAPNSHDYTAAMMI